MEKYMLTAGGTAGTTAGGEVGCGLALLEGNLRLWIQSLQAQHVTTCVGKGEQGGCPQGNGGTNWHSGLRVASMWEAGATQGGLIQKGSVTDNGSNGRSLSLSEKGAMNVERRKPDCTRWHPPWVSV